jgi:transcription elongation factor GreB
MSKAFLRESDFEEPETPPPLVSLLPPGSKNYLTPRGAERLRNELTRLADVERPALGNVAGDPELKRQLQAIDLRIRYLRDSLRTAEIVAPPTTSDDTIRFGAIVTVRDTADRSESRYRLVGVDEAEPEQGSVSWLSPIARALLNARRGDLVTFKVPAGTKELEIVSVDYDRAPGNG